MAGNNFTIGKENVIKLMVLDFVFNDTICNSCKKQLLDWIKEIVPVTICCLLADMHSHSIVDDFTSGFHLYMVWSNANVFLINTHLAIPFQ